MTGRKSVNKLVNDILFEFARCYITISEKLLFDGYTDSCFVTN